MGQDMRPHVVHRPHGQIQRPRQTSGKGTAHQKRAIETGATGVSDPVYIRQRTTRLFQSPIQHGQNVLLVGPRRKFGNHAPVFGVDVLRRRELRQHNIALHDGNARVVA